MKLYILLVWFSDLFAGKHRRSPLRSELSARPPDEQRPGTAALSSLISKNLPAQSV